MKNVHFEQNAPQKNTLSRQEGVSGPFASNILLGGAPGRCGGPGQGPRPPRAPRGTQAAAQGRSRGPPASPGPTPAQGFARGQRSN